MFNQVLFLQGGAPDPSTASSLRSKRCRIHGLDIPRLGHRNDNVFIVNEVFDPHFTRVVRHFATARICELVANLGHLVGDNFAQHLVITEYQLIALDLLDQLGHLVFQVGTTKSSQSTKRHVQNVLRLLFREAKRFGD